jgi:exopolysaccharide production protein ExoQ
MRINGYFFAALLAITAVVGGLGTVYAPVPTYCLVAAVFIPGLWLRFRKGRLDPAGMEAPQSTPSALGGQRGDLVGKLVAAYLFAWWVMLIYPLALYTPLEVGGAHTVATTVSGSLKNQLLVGSFGVVGMLFLPAALRRVREAFWWLLALWGLYMVWGYASLFWSEYPAISFRNLVAFLLVTVGSFGLGAGFYGSRPDGTKLFLKHLVVGGLLSALAVLLPLPLHWSEYDPLNPGQRVEISGNFTTFASRPTMIAALALVLASVMKLRRWRYYDWFTLLVLMLPAFTLKTRGPVLWSMLALGAVYLIYKSGVRERIFQAGMVAAFTLGYFVVKYDDLLAPLVPYLTRDNTELSMTLTGRLPLWDALIPMVAQHPWLGAGFSAFWNPENLYLMERVVGFPVVAAHNGFLEELLNTGAVGLFLFMAFWVTTMAVVYYRARQNDTLGWIALLFMIYYLLSNLTTSLMQEYLEVPFLVVFIVIGIMAVKPREKDTSPTNTALSRSAKDPPSLHRSSVAQEVRG